MAQKRRGKMTRKQRQRQLHRRMFLTGVLVVLICVGIYSGIRRVAKTASDITAVDYSGSDYEDNDITDWTGAPPIDVEASDAEQLVQTADEAEKGGRYRYSLHRKPGKHGDAEP